MDHSCFFSSYQQVKQGMVVMDAVSNGDIIYIIIFYRVDKGGQRGIIDRNRERTFEWKTDH